MRLIRSYILKDFFSNFIFALLILSTIMPLGNLIKLSDMVVRKGVSLLDAIKIFSFCVPYLLGFTLPLAFLLGVLLAMGRLIADNELVAINIAGQSALKILAAFLPLAIMFSLGVFILNDRLIPTFHYRYRQELRKVYAKSITTLIEPGVFSENFSNHIIYVSEMEGNEMHNVFIYQIDNKDEASQVIFAKSGKFLVEDNILRLNLKEGFRDQNNPEKQEMYRLDFKTLSMDIPLDDPSNIKAEKKPQDLRLTEIKDKIIHFKKIGLNPLNLRIEFYKRISFSFSIITFLILGFGVSLAVKHREKSINFGIALVSAGMYYLLFIIAQAFVQHSKIKPAMMMWVPNLIIIAIGISLISKYAHNR